MRTDVIRSLALVATLAIPPLPAFGYEVGLVYRWFAERPSAVRTRVHGTSNVSPDRFETLHVSRIPEGLSTTWRAVADDACARSLDPLELDRITRTTARWIDRLGPYKALEGYEVESTVLLVPAGSSLKLQERIFDRRTRRASFTYGATLDCASSTESLAEAGHTLVHELIHVAFRPRRLERIAEEAAAYTQQVCARLDLTGRLPAATEVLNQLPPVVFDMFLDETAPVFIENRLRKVPQRSLRAGILAQLNIGLFLGNEPLESTTGPRADSLRGYCDCVYRELPDFQSGKPGDAWRASGGTSCST